MNLDIKQMRNCRLQYQESKEDHSETCKKIIEYGKFLGCEQAPGKEDVRVSLAYIEGMLIGEELPTAVDFESTVEDNP